MQTAFRVFRDEIEQALTGTAHSAANLHVGPAHQEEFGLLSLARGIEALVEILSEHFEPGDVDDIALMMRVSPSAVWALCTPGSPTYDKKFPEPSRYPTLRRTVWNRNAVQRYLDESLGDHRPARAAAPKGRRAPKPNPNPNSKT